MRRRFGSWAVAVVMSAAATLVLQGVAAAQEDGESSSPVESSEFVARRTPGMEAKAGTGRLGRALWIASVAALVAANVSDAKTSWNKCEGNGILAGTGGRFGAKGVAVKGGINALWIGSQVIALRKSREHRTIAIVNFAAASFFGVLAYRNSTIPPPGGVPR